MGETQLLPGVEWVRSIARTGDGTVIAGCDHGAVRVRTVGRSWLRTLAGGSNTAWSTQFAVGGRTAVVGEGAGGVDVSDTTGRDGQSEAAGGPCTAFELTTGEVLVGSAAGGVTLRIMDT
ncbi:hypothetical protein CP967_30055 [Streptomyces nitrosporeus]|uniref:WD40 repeat domain-containing protein n=1 Tax=Streptomyces nitrosporeus TaxID=28894 RepID=A0A5J6FLC1_9ACTN|nr:hypothetical protein [Streptomyces nitrosporeus]QEU75660.1 hypothetical protein CP967_30055 [Streptomyces nitrosporeus]GGY86963.1 hypothetical protein GCM10010327_16930 [Streptomyces nitrosporeus]